MAVRELFGSGSPRQAYRTEHASSSWPARGQRRLWPRRWLAVSAVSRVALAPSSNQHGALRFCLSLTSTALLPLEDASPGYDHLASLLESVDTRRPGSARPEDL